MDFSKISDDNFDIKGWINKTLENGDLPLEEHATNIISKLQLFIEEMSNSIEETSHVALSHIPSIVRNINSIKIDIDALKEDMTLVKDEFENVEQKTSVSMKTLVEIDAVKQRMHDVSNSLNEADNWSNLETEVNELFKEGCLQKVATKIIGMQKGLVLLETTPGNKERVDTLETFKNKLEALSSPTIVQAFNEHNIEDAKYYVRLFAEINRSTQINIYYFNFLKTSLTMTWRDVQVREAESIVSFLTVYYTHVLIVWNREIYWCEQVFSNPMTVLTSLLTLTFKNFRPSIAECIEAAVNQKENPLDILIELTTITKKFSAGILESIQSYEIEVKIIQEILSLIKKPLFEHWKSYGSYQQAVLSSIIDSVPTEYADISDAIDHLSDSITAVFGGAYDGMNTCMLITDGYAAWTLIQTLHLYFSSYLSKLESMLQNIKRQSLDEDKEEARLSNNHPQQWTQFQHAFRLLDKCGSILLKNDEFRDKLDQSLKFVLSNVIETKNGDDDMTVCRHFMQENMSWEWEKLINLKETLILNNSNASILPSIHSGFEKFNNESHEFAFNVIFNPLCTEIMKFPKSKIFCERSNSSISIIGSALPQFSLSPSSIITYVGDSLLLLPQQLETYFEEENVCLMKALEMGLIPYHKEKGGVKNCFSWIESFSAAVQDKFVRSFLKIKQFNALSCSQLSTDIEYLVNILRALEIHPRNELIAIGIHMGSKERNVDLLAKKYDVSSNVIEALKNIPI